MYENIALLALFAFVYSVVAGRLDRTYVNGPVVYLFFGLIAGPVGLGLLNLNVGGEAIRTIAELTLVLVLFTDASNADLSVLRRTFHLPQRLLLVGLPLTILFGLGTGSLLFPTLGFLEVAILATMLAPTDAALGKAVVSNPVVPSNVRQGLNVESGLNDGICVPILLTFLALASHKSGSGSPGTLALRLVVQEIGLGLVIGVGLTVVGAWALRMTARRGWVVDPWVGITIVALAFACFALTQFAGGSGFIACFSGGLVFGALTKEHKKAVLEGAEATGEVFSLVTWVIFGAAVVFQHPGTVDWRVVLYAVLSLTVVRMVPVFLSVVGLGLRTDAKLFLGWFGPRGLASIVFLVMVMAEKLPGSDTIVATTVATVVLSIVAHGITANPLSAAFGARAKEPRAVRRGPVG
jgi:NhaP-type Na+/H+ or K+/H+ antiporter